MTPAPSRHQLGQWFTPPEVADLVLSLVTEGRAGLDIVDPTCGEGVFLERARAAGGGRVRGLDIDPQVVAAVRGRYRDIEVSSGSLFAVEPDDWLADAVVGNPPYVRQERMGQETKAAGLRCLDADWSGVADALVKIGRRADLAALCIARMLRMTRQGGRVGLVVSSALFDAGYARALWRGLQDVASVVAVVESPEERWFPDAAVNAVILVLERGAPVRRFPVARLSVPVSRAREQVSSVADLARVADVRWADPAEPSSWASLLRAPQAWFDFCEAAGSALVPLGEVAEVRRGITSGANEIFYLGRDRARALGIESEMMSPLVRSPRESGAETIHLDPAATPMVALTLPRSCDPARDAPAAWAHLCGYAGAAERPTLRVRDPWWALPDHRARLFLTKAYANRFVQRFSARPVVADQRVYTIQPREGVELEVLAAILNSTYTALALEARGRASLGEGALEWTVSDARLLPILDPRRLARGRSGVLRGALSVLSHRPVGSVEHEHGRKDRIALDRAAAAIAGPEAVELRDAVSMGLLASVARRIRKAGSA